MGQKLTVFIIAGLLTSLWAQPAAPTLSGVKQVYLLPMGHGLDQFLANQLANEGFFAVVTDLRRADAVFTDRIGLSFEEQLAALGVPARISEPAQKQQTAEKEPKQEAGSATMAEAITTEGRRRPISTFGRGRGTIFLVDLKTRRVLWSTFVEIEDYSPKELNRVAGRVVARLKERLGLGSPGNK